MMYLSRGLPMNTTRPDEFCISLHGKAYALGPKLSILWSNARYGPAGPAPGNERLIQRMTQAGLAVVTDEPSGKLAAYRLLSQCVLCPVQAPETPRRIHLVGRNKRIWTWINSAGLRLTTCELIRLEEQHLSPVPELLGDTHRRDLIDAIYSHDAQEDQLLLTAMEHSPARDAVVSSLLRLLRDHYLFLA